MEGHPHSAASLSTCAGLRWVLQAGRPSPSRGVSGAQEEGVGRAQQWGPWGHSLGATASEPPSPLPQGLLPGRPRCPPDRAPGGGRGGRATRPVPGAAPAAGGWHLRCQRQQPGEHPGAAGVCSLQTPGEWRPNASYCSAWACAPPGCWLLSEGRVGLRLAPPCEGRAPRPPTAHPALAGAGASSRAREMVSVCRRAEDRRAVAGG